jgi:hypothetical protein
LSKKKEIDSYRYYYEYYVETKKEYHTTRCVLCFSNCHLKCELNETAYIGHNIFKGCTAFYGKANAICKECNHNYKFHVHRRSIFELKKIANTFTPEVCK